MVSQDTLHIITDLLPFFAAVTFVIRFFLHVYCPKESGLEVVTDSRDGVVAWRIALSVSISWDKQETRWPPDLEQISQGVVKKKAWGHDW